MSKPTTKQLTDYLYDYLESLDEFGLEEEITSQWVEMKVKYEREEVEKQYEEENEKTNR